MTSMKHQLAQGLSHEDLIERSLALAQSPPAQSVFLKLYAAEALAQARTIDTRLKRAPLSSSSASQPLLGLPVSIKDLFDVEGECTHAGSVVLQGSALAHQDAHAVQSLKASGAIVLGRTNMTEFAFSGIGINPHHGTPVNPCDPHTPRIPGGSSSGAAVSVALGICHAALGSDTGGSIRIPAALCGLVGFKNTQTRVSIRGTVPLCPAMDTVCAITKSVTDAIELDQVLSGQFLSVKKRDLKGLKFLVPQTVVMDDLESGVANAFERSLAALSRKGAIILQEDVPILSEMAEINTPAGLSPIEAWAEHHALVMMHEKRIDPRVVVRLKQGQGVSAAQYWDLLKARAQWILNVQQAFSGFDAVLCPTTPMVAPAIASLRHDDEAFTRANRLMLRNTSVFNFLDGCSISLPCQSADELPMGLMLSHVAGQDAQLLGIALVVESCLASFKS
jgi:aspartyl-tRNA(Asn)/glutamyl-tRNA(Gln) amidotransferase subunit A